MAASTVSLFGPVAAEAAALVERLRRSVVLVESGHGHGSGVIWDSTGLIVTNHHVVSRDRAVVELADGRRLAGTVVARDRENDLAALQVPATELPAAPIGDSRQLRLGELIVAVGHPLGVRNSATLGIVSALGNATWMGRARRELLQADLALAPGNSGGPLADTTGAVVGIASMVISPGIALAVPSHVVGHFVAGVQAFRRSGVQGDPDRTPERPNA
jgi:serine protease Do